MSECDRAAPTPEMRDELLMLRSRLKRVALTADISSHYIQDMRVMPAEGVARVMWDAMDFLDDLPRPQDAARIAELEKALAQALLACRIVDDVAKAGHETLGSMVAHFLEAIEPARAALGEDQP